MGMSQGGWHRVRLLAARRSYSLKLKHGLFSAVSEEVVEKVEPAQIHDITPLLDVRIPDERGLVRAGPGRFGLERWNSATRRGTS